MAELPQDLFLAVDHVGIAVADLDQAIEFYESTFGMRVLHREANLQQGVVEAMLQVGEGATLLQLLAPLSSESPIAKFLDHTGPGVQQIAYRVADIAVVCEHLRTRGLRILYKTPRLGTAGSLINFIHPRDAGGVLVELVQPLGEISS
jgi:methylmalonyl-CoA/ethylmalonyl-CoA epimerase